MKQQQKPIKLIVVGTSLGGFNALRTILSPLPADFPIPILVVRHHSAQSDDYLIRVLNQESQLKIQFAEDRDIPAPGNVYIAPPDRHLLVSKSGKLKLSADKAINFSRPAIDPLFKSAAKLYGSSLLAVVLTGANKDGAKGVVEIKKKGGKVMVQDPAFAEADAMPKAALEAVEADYVIWLDQIGPQLWTITRSNSNKKQ
ncbi:MAG: chemotaxis protein CheB [Magnetococcales bacterium]|nr:chemotaxis protein CheB [Magnetococcales bacterium]